MYSMFYDDPNYFYNFVQRLIDGLEEGVNAHDTLNIQNVSASSCYQGIISFF